nr:TIGR04222 domain-containing membrane protein [Micromonospora sp. DSM 115978]
MISGLELDAVAYLLVAGVFMGLVALTRAAITGAGWLPETGAARWTRGGAARALTDLGPYELAYLRGGAGHTVDTAFAVLHSTGTVRVSRAGRLSLVDGAVAPDGPVERTVYDALAGEPTGMAAHELRKRTVTSSAVTGLRQRLVSRMLLVPRETLTPAYAHLAAHLAISIAAVVVPLLMFLLAGPPPTGGGAVAVALAVSAVTATVGIRGFQAGLRAVAGLGVPRTWNERRLPGDRLPPVVDGELHRWAGTLRRGRTRTPAATASIGVAVGLCGLVALGDPAVAEALAESEDEAGTGLGGCGGCGGGGCGCGG